MENGSFLFPLRLRNPLGLLIFKYTPHFQGLKKCLMDSVQIMTKTCLLSTSASSLLFPTTHLEGSLITWKKFYGFNLLHGLSPWEKFHHFFQWSHKKQIKIGQISINIHWFTCFYYPLLILNVSLEYWKKRSNKEMVLFTVSTIYPQPSHNFNSWVMCCEGLILIDKNGIRLFITFSEVSYKTLAPNTLVPAVQKVLVHKGQEMSYLDYFFLYDSWWR